MPTFLLLTAVLLGRLLSRVVGGATYVLLLPARTAIAVAPHVAHPRWVLALGILGTLVVSLVTVLLLRGAAR